MKSAILFALTASLAAASLPAQAQSTGDPLMDCWQLCAEQYPNNPSARAGCRQRCIRDSEGRQYAPAREDASLVSNRLRGTKLHKI
jgi:hypothetical protein